MKYLEDYMAPSEEELRGWSMDQAKEINRHNKEIYARNKRLVANARQIILKLDPSMSMVRDVEPAVPPVDYVHLLQKEQAVERERQALQDERSASSFEAAQSDGARRR